MSSHFMILYNYVLSFENVIDAYDTDHFGPRQLKHANNKGADQPAHMRSLISAIVVRCFHSIINTLAIHI